MRPFYTMLLALAIVVLYSDVVTKVVTANGGGATGDGEPHGLQGAPDHQRHLGGRVRFRRSAGARTAVSHLVVVRN
ncbi:hypothetical protein CFC21_095768 [Triticum aestivum]|uniref:Secreted protein n=1 Tax=Triticum aestivum TaxID=4565 RepID=A0A9R1LQU5_WHEAT|nr:hypothetical protein CFC21_095768 [Triticum aestivum]